MSNNKVVNDFIAPVKQPIEKIEACLNCDEVSMALYHVARNLLIKMGYEREVSNQFPQYGWDQKHEKAILEFLIPLVDTDKYQES